MNNTNINTTDEKVESDNTKKTNKKIIYDIDVTPANIFKRAVAFLIDSLAAFIPVFVVLLFFSSDYKGYGYYAPAMYAAPAIGTVAIIDVPFEANETINTTVAESTGAVRVEHNYSLGATAVRVLAVVAVAFYLLYGTFATYLFDGHTLGKYLMKIDVVAVETQRPGLKIILREFVGKALLNSLLVPIVISIFTIIFTPKHLALHDIIFKTRVTE